MPGTSPSPSDAGGHMSAPEDHFYHVHQTLNAAVRRGHCVAAMALLSLPSIHGDPRFWTSVHLNVSLIASAVIHHSILVTPSSAETQVDDCGQVLDGLSPADLLILLKRTGGDGSLLTRITERLEAAKEKSATPRRERSWTVPLATQAPPPVAPVLGVPHAAIEQTQGPSTPQEEHIDLAEVAALLAAKISPSQELESEQRGQRSATTSLQLTVVPMNQEGAPQRKRSRSPADGEAEELPPVMFSVVDPLAKPGSVRVSKTLEEYDAMLQPRPDRPGLLGRDAASKKRRTAFSEAEDDAILMGIARFPAIPGRFSLIFSAYKDIWAPSRTAQHLFDHWRGGLRHRAVNAAIE